MSVQPQQLIVAVQSADVDLVRTMLQNGDEDVNQLAADGMTSLGIVVQGLVSKSAEDLSRSESYLSIFRMLLENGADIDTGRRRSLSPLWLACKAGRIDLVDPMLRLGHSSYTASSADSLRDDRRLRRRVDYRPDLIRVFVDRQSPALEYESFLDSWTPLMAAASSGNIELMLLLFAFGRGDSVNEVSRIGQLALHLLSYKDGDNYRLVDTVDALLAAYDDDRTVNMMTDRGFTLLCKFAFGGLPNICQSLIDRGANPNIGRLRCLPLVTVCRSSDMETFEVLLSAGADPNGEPAQTVDLEEDNVDDDEFVELYSEEPRSRSSLPLCSTFERVDDRVVLRMFSPMMNRLIEVGADVNRLDDDGWSPLHRAVECFKIDTIEDNDYEVINYEVDEDDGSENRNDDSSDEANMSTAEYFFLKVKRYSNHGDDWQRIINTLLVAGADPNRLSLCGQTPLRHLAANISRARMVAREYDESFPPIERFLPNIATVFSVLVERSDCLGASLFEPEDNKVKLHDMLMYCDHKAVDLMLRMLTAGVGRRTLAEFCRGAFQDRVRSPIVSVELCEAVVVLNGYRPTDAEVNAIRQLAVNDRTNENQKILQDCAAWLESRQSNPPMLKHLCRTDVRRRLAAANEQKDMAQLVDKLLPDCPGLNKYLKGVDLISAV